MTASAWIALGVILSFGIGVGFALGCMLCFHRYTKVEMARAGADSFRNDAGAVAEVASGIEPGAPVWTGDPRDTEGLRAFLDGQPAVSGA